jgi:hypothetical protein
MRLFPYGVVFEIIFSHDAYFAAATLSLSPTPR